MPCSVESRWPGLCVQHCSVVPRPATSNVRPASSHRLTVTDSRVTTTDYSDTVYKSLTTQTETHYSLQTNAQACRFSNSAIKNFQPDSVCQKQRARLFIKNYLARNWKNRYAAHCFLRKPSTKTVQETRPENQRFVLVRFGSFRFDKIRQVR